MTPRVTTQTAGFREFPTAQTPSPDFPPPPKPGGRIRTRVRLHRHAHDVRPRPASAPPPPPGRRAAPGAADRRPRPWPLVHVAPERGPFAALILRHRGRSPRADAPSAPRPAKQPSAAAAALGCFHRAVRHRQALQRWRPFEGPGRHPSSPPSPWSAGAGGGLHWTPYQREAQSDAFTRGLGDHRRCPNPAELTAPGSVWSPNARWARI